MEDTGCNPCVSVPSSSMFGSLCLNESKARDFEKLTDLVVTSNAFPGKQGLVRTCLEMCALDLTEVYSPALFSERSMQVGLSTGSCRLGDGPKSRRDKCSDELRSARSKVLIASPPCTSFLTFRVTTMGAQEGDHTSYVLCASALDRCIVVIISSLNASSWDEQCLKDPCVAGICCQANYGFARELTSQLTNRLDLAETIEKWHEGVSGVRPDKHE